jgi:hypothetical protein
MLLHGLLLCFLTRSDFGTSMPIKSQGGVHFINAADERRGASDGRRSQLIWVFCRLGVERVISTSRAFFAVVGLVAVQSRLVHADCLPTLQLELSAATVIVLRDRPVDVTVTLGNPLRQGTVPSLCALVPTLLLEAEPHSEAYPVVLFEIVGPTEAMLRPTKPQFAIPVRPSLERFSYLAPGRFLGMTVSLESAPLGFDMRQPGLYSITATLATSARDYVDAELKRAGRKQHLSVDPRDVFQGKLRSNTVKVTVQ